MVYQDGRRYKGPMLHGKMHGVGILKYRDGTTFFGPFVDGREHGQGEVTKDRETVRKARGEKGRCDDYIAHSVEKCSNSSNSSRISNVTFPGMASLRNHTD